MSAPILSTTRTLLLEIAGEQSEIACEIRYTIMPAELRTMDDPAHPMQAEVLAVMCDYAGGNRTNLSPLLSKDQLAAIEESICDGYDAYQEETRERE